MMDEFDELIELQQQKKELESQIRLLKQQIKQTNEAKMTFGCTRMLHDTSTAGCGPRKDEWLI